MHQLVRMFTFEQHINMKTDLENLNSICFPFYLFVCNYIYSVAKDVMCLLHLFAFHKSWILVEIAWTSVSKDKALKNIAPVTKQENLWPVSSKIKNSGFIVIRYGSKELNLEPFLLYSTFLKNHTIYCVSWKCINYYPWYIYVWCVLTYTYMFLILYTNTFQLQYRHLIIGIKKILCNKF